MTLRNIKLTIQYDGTNYSGWQFQNNAKTIQEVIQKAIKKITGQRANLTAAGRTDAGVHAQGQVANFRTRSKIPGKKLQMALNSVLPKDIAISRLQEAGQKFNSQHDAKTKLYRYTVVNSSFVNPLMRNFAAKCFYSIDVNRMRKAARYLVGSHDFTSFKTFEGDKESAIRKIIRIRIEKFGNLVYIYMESDGFLYNMARNIVGTLIEVGRGKIEANAVKDILRKKDRKANCGPTMPANGLCLVKVRY